jgi:two-component system, OmpR family, response regulator
VVARVGAFLRKNAGSSGCIEKPPDIPLQGPSSQFETYPVHLQAYVIEDNATIRENLVGTLEELTCLKVAGTSATEDEAIEWLEENVDRWDLVIVDLFLKQGSGIHLAQRIQRRRASQKIVVFSNYINASVRKRCAQLGVDAVFDKSTEIDALVDYCAHQCYRVSQAQAA